MKCGLPSRFLLLQMANRPAAENARHSKFSTMWSFEYVRLSDKRRGQNELMSVFRLQLHDNSQTKA